jgi:hypothetical protein
MERSLLEAAFPGLRETEFRITSPRDVGYNCIAFVLGLTHQWWWPSLPGRGSAWPASLPVSDRLEAFLQMFRLHGYEPSDTEDLEPGMEKVAIYGHEGEVAHAARQLPDGNWTSKLGQSYDIEHDLRALEGDRYGQVLAILSRPVSTQTLLG